MFTYSNHYQSPKPHFLCIRYALCQAMWLDCLHSCFYLFYPYEICDQILLIKKGLNLLKKIKRTVLFCSSNEIHECNYFSVYVYSTPYWAWQFLFLRSHDSTITTSVYYQTITTSVYYQTYNLVFVYFVNCS